MIVHAEDARVSGPEIESLLERVYVGGGLTEPDVARSMFAASAVRARGELLVAREGGVLCGMVIVVPPTSPARRLATPEEAEMHLLAVHPDQRGRGLGRALVEAAMRRASELGHRRMILWTQPSMHAAHRLYEATGFVRAKERDFHRGDRAFQVYEAAL